MIKRQTNSYLKTETMKNHIEIAQELGGIIESNRVYFTFNDSVSDENLESITLPEAIEIEKKMMDAGFDGALIGTLYNDLDPAGIYFELPKYCIMDSDGETLKEGLTWDEANIAITGFKSENGETFEIVAETGW